MGRLLRHLITVIFINFMFFIIYNNGAVVNLTKLEITEHDTSNTNVEVVQEVFNTIDKSKLDKLSKVLKERVEVLRNAPNGQVELVFLVDSSSSVGVDNYYNELKFVKKLLADFTVAFDSARVAVITFSSRSLVLRIVDHLTNATVRNNKCRLLEQIPRIKYTGGGTFTHGAIVEAQRVFESARPDALKSLFLLTDGFSNGIDPRPIASDIRRSGVEFFTFGIRNGNVQELMEMASEPKSQHCYIVDSFEEFEALARRALHEDLPVGNYEPEANSICSSFCEGNQNCCSPLAQCSCGTHTGHYACVCQKGYYGSGLNNECFPCPEGTYSDGFGVPDISSCKNCTDVNQISNSASTSVANCKCRNGYEQQGNRCMDTEPPLLECPPNINTGTDDEKSTAKVTWKPPITTDNSLEVPTLTSIPNIIQPMTFPIGESTITYTAKDTSNNYNTCNFTVTVSDFEPPTIDKCVSPPVFLSQNTSVSVVWDEPIFSDNSGQPVHVEKSASTSQLFQHGDTQVTYTAWDNSGNNSTCIVTITIQDHPCSSPVDPINGHRNCFKQTDTVFCSLTCKEGYAFAISPSDVYSCANDGMWSPNNRFPFPDCAVTVLPTEAIIDSILTMRSKEDLPCEDAFFIHQVEKKMHKKLSEKTTEYCVDDMNCEVSHISAMCEHFLHGAEEEVSYILRKRRSIRSTENYNSKVYISNGEKLLIEFQVKAKLIKNSNRFPHPNRSSINDDLVNFIDRLRDDALKGELDLQMGKVHQIKYAGLQFPSSSPNGSRVLCNPGSVLKDNLCVNCPIGTYYNVISEECQSCDKGSYQFREGQLSCLICPGNETTNKHASKSVEDCRDRCLPGSFSSNGLEICETCDIGFYQPEYSQTACLPCPTGFKTHRRGARRSSDCREMCSHGFVSETGLAPCYPCPNGYNQPNGGQNYCFINSYQESLVLNVTNESVEVLQVNDCFSMPCGNNGSCIVLTFGYICECLAGFTGMNCETKVNQPEWTSIDEETELKFNANDNSCKSDECLNGAICNYSNGSARCICAPGFYGISCEMEVDNCDSQPCINGATCVDYVNAFYCICPPTFTGIMCDTILSDDFVLHFSKSSATDYVLLDKLTHRDLTVVSSCLWMKTDDKENYGTPLSYATNDIDNVFTLVDYNGFAFYVNGHHVVTDVTVNDGHWHFVCVTWTSDNGTWMIYKDGIKVDGGDGLSTGTSIQTDGTLVLGQEQDRIGGAFSESESFVGRLTRVNFWDRKLSSSEINEMMFTCEQPHGIIRAWPDFFPGIQGKLKIENSTFCKGCSQDDSIKENCYFRHSPIEETVDRRCLVSGQWSGNAPKCESDAGYKNCSSPSKLLNGHLETTGNMYNDSIHYKCNSGYRLSGNEKRLCLANGQWMGQPPICIMIQCKEPIPPIHGYVMVNERKFGHVARFICEDGYQLIGKNVSECGLNAQWTKPTPICSVLSKLP